MAISWSIEIHKKINTYKNFINKNLSAQFYQNEVRKKRCLLYKILENSTWLPVSHFEFHLRKCQAHQLKQLLTFSKSVQKLSNHLLFKKKNSEWLPISHYEFDKISIHQKKVQK